jgi:hypothetical protein
VSRATATVAALLLLATSCRQPKTDGIAVDSLRFADGMVVPSGLLSPRASLDSFLVRWWSSHLAAAGEGRLGTSGPAEPETYRFLWLRSFHHPVVIRLSHMRRGGFIVSTELNGAGGYAPGRRLRRDSMGLSDAVWTSFQALIAREAFWTRPATDTAHQGLDGAEWIIEATRKGRYTIVARWAPATSESAAFMRRLGLELLRLGRVSVPAADVY